MNKQAVIIKPGKEKAVVNRHHWIFSGAVARFPEFTDGDILPVQSHIGKFLGSGYFNRKSGIVGRMICFDATPPLEAIAKNLLSATLFRASLFQNSRTNAYRLVNGEGDGLPGLVIDHYNGIVVIQISTLGMEKLKPFIIDWLQKNVNPKSIYEKSELPSRKEEGLKDFSGLLFGEDFSLIEIEENGLRFFVDIKGGQKTGFFCDTREMRRLIQNISHGKSVLNCFAYSGGFTLYALAGGASKVDSVDISENANSLARQNVTLNGFESIPQNFYATDVFDFLRQNPLHYDIVILDPPAFAKRQKDVVAACRGYKDINRIAMQKMPAKSYLLTCSCSYHIEESLFQKVIFQAAVEAGRFVRIIGRHIIAPDHPINICHKESDYLKSLLLYVE